MLYGCYEVRIHPPMTLQKHCCHFLISTGYEGGWDSFKNCYNSTYLVLASGIFLTQLTKNGSDVVPDMFTNWYQMNWVPLLEIKQTGKPLGFIQQPEEAWCHLSRSSEDAGFPWDIVDPATSSFHRRVEAIPAGEEAGRCQLVPPCPGFAFMILLLWRKAVMVSISRPHPSIPIPQHHWLCFPLSPFAATFQHLAVRYLVLLCSPPACIRH